MNLQVESRSPAPGVAVVAITGEADVYTSPRIKQALLDLLDAGTNRIVVDLTPTEYFDSTALGVLTGGLRRARDSGGDLRIVCSNPRQLRIFEITGLSHDFSLHPSAEAALEGWSGREA